MQQIQLLKCTAVAKYKVQMKSKFVSSSLCNCYNPFSEPYAYKRCNLPQFLIFEMINKFEMLFVLVSLSNAFLQLTLSKFFRGLIQRFSKTKSHACECALLLVEIFHRYIIPRIAEKKNQYKKMLIYFYRLINNIQNQYSSKEFDA